MSGNTELQRALNRYRIHQVRVLSWCRRYVFPIFRLRVIKGVIIGAHHGPLRGVRITLNGWKTITTDDQGHFAFHFVFRPVSYLTVEWREAELINWIKVDATRQRISELKLKWPPLVRGQLVDSEGTPISLVAVAFNHQQIAQTDAHGTFIFPLDEELSEGSDQLVFQVGDYSYVHHFKANPKAHLLHRFMLSESEGLFHLEDRPAAQAVAKQLSQFTERLKWGLRASIFLIIFYVVLNVIITQQNKEALTQLNHRQDIHLVSQLDEQTSVKSDKVSLLERNTQAKHQTDESNEDRSSVFEGTMKRANLDDLVDGFDQPECQSMEFIYRNYYVPRGMEGILLSLVFGHWQSWRDELSIYNGLGRHDQLQAGQRVKLKLPLYAWSLYKHENASSWSELFKMAKCQGSETLCKLLIQSWNPHVPLHKIRKRDQLLINLMLLKRRPFEGATLSRIEGLRRGNTPRRRSPRIKLAKDCKLRSSLDLSE